MRIIAIAATLFFLLTPGEAAEQWQQDIATGLGKAGAEAPGGVYRVSLPRTDLQVTLDGVRIRPALALGSWLSFEKVGDHVMVMGDLVLTQEEVNPVLTRLQSSGLKITALHNRLLRASPATLYMHVHGHGEAGQLATSLREALSASKTPLSEAAAVPQASGGPGEQAVDLDTAAIDSALGRNGKVNGGVYQVSVLRAEAVIDDGREAPEAMGSAIAINFQPTGSGKAAITGDFVLTADEVNPVIQVLVTHEIEVTALHNHMLNDEPRLFFMHFWANDDARKLASGLRAAIDRVKVKS